MSIAIMQESAALGAALQAEAEIVPLEQARRAFERDYLVRILNLTRGNVTRAAHLAGRNRTEFYRLLDRHELAPAAFKPSGRGSKPFKPQSAP